MNYYPHHIGDYAKDTGHLSWDEDMAYTRLLRAYYSREGPIPADQAYRLARASSATQKKAVDSVLAEFFTQSPEGWRNKRADAELAIAHEKSEKARTSAAKRWQSNASNANAMRTHSEGNAPNNQEPITNNQKPKKTPSAAYAPPGWVDLEKWKAWIAIRPAKARTPDALKAAVEKLEGFRSQGHDPNAIIANSLANGWQGLFPLDRNAAVTENLADFMARRDANRAAG